MRVWVMSSETPKKRTVGQVLKLVLPSGTLFRELLEDAIKEVPKSYRERREWYWTPNYPTDCFAASAYLCKIGGVAGYFEPGSVAHRKTNYHFAFPEGRFEKLRKAARKWRHSKEPPKLVREEWGKLIDCWDDPISPKDIIEANEKPADWWIAAFSLVVVSDLACQNGAGGTEEPSPFMTFAAAQYTLKSEDSGYLRSPASYATLADRNVACVIPKARVSGVGATLRNVTENLSLLPASSEVRCHYDLLAQNVIPREDTATMDVLLIPEPRKLSADFFEPVPNGPVEGGQAPPWSYFKLQQKWIDRSAPVRDQFVQFCVELMKAAKRESATVNAVVLPEYALDYELFELLCERLKDVEKNLEFVISGVSKNCEDEDGNQVMTRVWLPDEVEEDKKDKEGKKDKKDKEDFSVEVSRQKHHRWRMDRTQISTYALSAALNPATPHWWEDTPIGRRQIHIQRIRRSSILSVLICEELARSDPCHEILRSIAPNLIIALLLDGPQIKQRWPAQYAANLADDPGTSVLTFTSYGLIERSNMVRSGPKTKAIALWKDDGGNFVEIDMPDGDGMRGVLLSLWSEEVRDRTIVGGQKSVRAWRYATHIPVHVNA